MKGVQQFAARVAQRLLGVDAGAVDRALEKAIASEEASFVADPIGWMRRYLSETDRLDREILGGLWRYFEACAGEDSNPALSDAVNAARNVLTAEAEAAHECPGPRSCRDL